MHAFPTTTLHTTSSQFAILAAQDNSNSNAGAVLSRTSSPPLLSPISEASMHTATDDGSKWISQQFYTLLVAISQLGLTHPRVPLPRVLTPPQTVSRATQTEVSVLSWGTPAPMTFRRCSETSNSNTLASASSRSRKRKSESEREPPRQRTRSRSRRSQSSTPT